MNIKNLKVSKNSRLKTKLYALSLASAITMTTTGCTESSLNNDSKRQEQSSSTMKSTDNIPTYLDTKSPEIYSVKTLTNGQKRGILLSDEPHLYKNLDEKTDNKVYLSDEDGNRLSNNFDELSLLDNYRYLMLGGAICGWKEVETDKKYDYFVGTTLRKDSNDRTLGQRVTLLDENGLELSSFNGYFKALIGNTLVIQEYFVGEDKELGSPDTYLYDYMTGEKSEEKYNYVETFKYKNKQDERTTYLIGVNTYSKKDYVTKGLYSFYDTNMKVADMVAEDEIKSWYQSQNDEYSFYNAGGNYKAYFESVYQNMNSEKNKQLILKRDSKKKD